MLTLLFLRRLILTAVDIYMTVIIIYVLMSWIPNVSYGTIGRVYDAFGRICEPFLSPFRRIIPPIGGMVDISPIFAIIVLQLVGRLLAWIL